MKLARVLVVVIIFFIFLVPIHSTRADAGPEPDPNLGGLQPFGYVDTEVQMIYERVEIDVASEPTPFDYEERFATVTAWFVMQNTGTEPESMQAVFPLKSFDDCNAESSNVIADSFEVYVNGVLTPYSEVVTDHPHKSERPYCKTMKWAGFDVTFPVDQDVLIKVNYKTDFEGWDIDSLEYTLETGAGWKGPIGRGYIIIRFPYTISNENILESSVPGYQFLYNEIFWSFQNLEPAKKDNIKVTFVPPDTWQEIIRLRNELEHNPQLPDSWLMLVDIYSDIARGDTKGIVYKKYRQKIEEAYKEAIAVNPYNPELPARYASFLTYSREFNFLDGDGNLLGGIDENDKEEVLLYINKALELDHNNQTAYHALENLSYLVPGLSKTYTPPPTLSPTATPLVSATPTLTPTETITPRGYTSPTPWPTETRTPTKKPKASVTPSVTPFPTQTSVLQPPTSSETSSGSGTIPLFAGMAVVFVAGLGIGYFVRRPKKEQQ
jgi:hypothetical protein